MRMPCPFCQFPVVQTKNRDGPNFCTRCNRLFYVPDEPGVPRWVFGVLVILLCNLQNLNL